jgi:hypothetical protein
MQAVLLFFKDADGLWANFSFDVTESRVEKAKSARRNWAK